MKEIKFRVLSAPKFTPFHDTTVGKVYDGRLYDAGETSPIDGYTVYPSPCIISTDDVGDEIEINMELRADNFEIVEA